MKRVSLVLAVIGLASCGGGGGSNSNLFSGVWNGQVVPIKNTCDFAVTPEIDFNFRVDKDGDKIVVTGEKTYQGTITSNNSFIATRAEETPCTNNSKASLILSIELTDITDEEALATLYADYGNCEGNGAVGGDSSCQQIYAGNVIRLEN